MRQVATVMRRIVWHVQNVEVGRDDIPSYMYLSLFPMDCDWKMIVRKVTTMIWRIIWQVEITV